MTTTTDDRSHADNETASSSTTTTITPVASSPGRAHQQHRAKLYHLKQNEKDWSPAGVGFARCDYDNATDFVFVVLVSENEPNKLLMRKRITPSSDYARTMPTVITWPATPDTESAIAEGDDEDMTSNSVSVVEFALSFEFVEGCAEVWEAIQASLALFPNTGSSGNDGGSDMNAGGDPSGVGGGQSMVYEDDEGFTDRGVSDFYSSNTGDGQSYEGPHSIPRLTRHNLELVASLLKQICLVGQARDSIIADLTRSDARPLVELSLKMAPENEEEEEVAEDEESIPGGVKSNEALALASDRRLSLQRSSSEESSRLTERNESNHQYSHEQGASEDVLHISQVLNLFTELEAEAERESRLSPHTQATALSSETAATDMLAESHNSDEGESKEGEETHRRSPSASELLLQLFEVLKSITLLDEAEIFECLLAEENFERVAGLFEYDPGMPFNPAHRRFLRERATFREVVPITNPTTKQMIVQRFRLGFARDVLFPRVLDEPAFKLLAAMDAKLCGEIVRALQGDAAFMAHLFRALNPKVDLAKDMAAHEKREMATTLLCELSALAQRTSITARDAFYALLESPLPEVHDGLLATCEAILSDPRSTPKERLNVCEVLLCAIRHNPGTVRAAIIASERSEEGGPETTGTSNFLDLLVRLIWRDPDAGVQAQACELLQTLLDPESMDFTDRKLLMVFYLNHALALVEPLQQFAAGPRVSETVATAAHLVCYFLSFCVGAHDFEFRRFIMESGVIRKVLCLCNAREKDLVLDAVRFVRTCLGIRRLEFFSAYIVKNDVLGPVVRAFLKNGVHNDNLLNSTCIDLLHYIALLEDRELIDYVLEKYGDALAPTADYVDVLARMMRISEAGHAASAHEGGALSVEVSGWGSNSTPADSVPRSHSDAKADDLYEEQATGSNSSNESSPGSNHAGSALWSTPAHLASPASTGSSPTKSPGSPGLAPALFQRALYEVEESSLSPSQNSGAGNSSSSRRVSILPGTSTKFDAPPEAGQSRSNPSSPRSDGGDSASADCCEGEAAPLHQSSSAYTGRASPSRTLSSFLPLVLPLPHNNNNNNARSPKSAQQRSPQRESPGSTSSPLKRVKAAIALADELLNSEHDQHGSAAAESPTSPSGRTALNASQKSSRDET